ncbi:MAG: hypothetical protein K2G01_08740 [Paramuribaculum sp.]|nr:hypothetical protein [Paramuribaculum sp.]
MILNTPVAILAMSLCLSFTSCDSNKAKTVLVDAGPIGNITHGGTFKGDVAVYTIDWLDHTSKRSEETYSVYEKSNGDYIIVYDGKDCLLKKADEPFGNGLYELKWKIDYNHYIEDIPTSW